MMGSNATCLIDLPENMLQDILCQLTSVRALSALLSCHRVFASMARADPTSWRQLVANHEWRLR